MQTAQAQRYVLVGVVGAGALATVAAYRSGSGPSVRIAVGVAASGALLSALAEVAPDIAGGLALLMVTGAALATGADAWKGIASAAGKGPKSKPDPGFISPPAYAASEGGGGTTTQV